MLILLKSDIFHNKHMTKSGLWSRIEAYVILREDLRDSPLETLLYLIMELNFIYFCAPCRYKVISVAGEFWVHVYLCK